MCRPGQAVSPWAGRHRHGRPVRRVKAPAWGARGTYLADPGLGPRRACTFGPFWCCPVPRAMRVFSRGYSQDATDL